MSYYFDVDYADLKPYRKLAEGVYSAEYIVMGSEAENEESEHDYVEDLFEVNFIVNTKTMERHEEVFYGGVLPSVSEEVVRKELNEMYGYRYLKTSIMHYALILEKVNQISDIVIRKIRMQESESEKMISFEIEKLGAKFVYRINKRNNDESLALLGENFYIPLATDIYALDFHEELIEKIRSHKNIRLKLLNDKNND
jgi:hypothetical protein